MTRFRLNARAFGGLGLILIIVILIAPLYAGLIERGFVTDLPSNVIQIEEGVRGQFPQSPSTVLLLSVMVISFIAFIFLFRIQRKRARS